MPVRVAIITPWGERLGGAEEMLWMGLRHCDRQRLDPAVVFLSQGPFAREVAGLGIETEVIMAGRLRQATATLGTIWKLAALLRRHRPDLVLNWSAKTQLYGAPAAVMAGIGNRVTWWQHGIPDEHWMDRLATLLPARAVGCSSNASQVAQAGLHPRRRSFVVNPGIDVFKSGGAGLTQLRNQLGIPPERLIVGIAGRLQPWKGQDRFLQALADLRARGRDVHGLVVGGDAYDFSPEYAADLKRLIPRLGLSHYVTMTGQVSDARPYYELMNVAVNASEKEPFGIVLLEAMAAGVPVVAVAAGGPLDIVEPGVSGVLSESGEPGALADAMETLISDPSHRAAIAAAGKRRCCECFTAQLMTDRLTARLTEIADG